MRMTRYWMTGCMALVLLAAGRWPEVGERDEALAPLSGWVTMTSRYSVDETIRKIERSARQQGLAVMARLEQGLQQGGRQAAVASAVLVLGDRGGQTPMIQADARLTPELPLKLLVAGQPDGSTRITFADGGRLLQDPQLPQEFAEPMTRLPQVLGTALS